MEKSQKSNAPSSTEPLTRKIEDLLTDWEKENDPAQFCFKEETIEEFMQDLYKEIITKPPSPTPTTPHLQDLPVSHVTKDESDFDDDWLARFLTWGQNHPHLLHTTDWF
ncbi:hypothetical protein VNO77_10592 [Canavalia gladiata]|uniref:Uncharacterized protein n=1 Tax=Canavalia gladiata TaxID=3824 RepID=A0AAN9QX76_CANGL